MQEVLLLCYPRSGSTFTEYILESLLGYDIKKRHGQDRTCRTEIEEILNRQASLILLLRNPLDSFIRHGQFELTKGGSLPPTSSYPPWPPTFLNIRTNFEIRESGYFFNNLKIFYSYEGPKKIVYYEDMAIRPEYYVGELCDFLKIGHTEKNEFMEGYEHHFKVCRDRYNKSGGVGNLDGCHSDGKTVRFHSRRFSDLYHREFWNSFIEICAPGTETCCERYYENFINLK